MLALEPFRPGREYNMHPEWVLDNVEPWDYPECECWDLPARADGEPYDHHWAFGDAANTRERWQALLACKRNDGRYHDLVRSLTLFGILQGACPTLKVDDKGSIYQWGDGHHRLAAMLELGYATIPVRAADRDGGWGELLRSDSGSDAEEWELTLADGTHIYDALYN